MAAVTEKPGQGVLLLLKGTQALYDAASACGYQRRDGKVATSPLGGQGGHVVFPSSSTSSKDTRLEPDKRAAGGVGPPRGARAGPGAHCGVGPAWVPRVFPTEPPSEKLGLACSVISR